MNQDEILLELVNSLKEQNEDLKRQLKDRPRSTLGISEMWIGFWNFVGGAWKDFWTAIAKMWESAWSDHDNASVAFTITTITVVITVALLVGYVWPTESRPIVLPTNQYTLTAYDKCFYVSQELTNGDFRRTSPCIKDKDEALSLLKSMRTEVVDTSVSE